jgi:hypothetical protein
VEQCAHSIGIAQIHFMDRDAVGYSGNVLALDPWIVKVVKIIENRNLMIKCEQFLDKVRTDKTCTACD